MRSMSLKDKFSRKTICKEWELLLRFGISLFSRGICRKIIEKRHTKQIFQSNHLQTTLSIIYSFDIDTPTNTTQRLNDSMNAVYEKYEQNFISTFILFGFGYLSEYNFNSNVYNVIYTIRVFIGWPESDTVCITACCVGILAIIYRYQNRYNGLIHTFGVLLKLHTLTCVIFVLWLTDNRANFSSMDFYVKAEAFFVDKLVFDVAIGIFLHIYAVCALIHIHTRRLTEVMKNKDKRVK